MWYGGGDSISVGAKFAYKGSIGYATSPDGVTWTKFVDNPVLVAGSLGEWDEFQVIIPEVIYEGSTYHMWYNGLNNNFFPFRIGYAVDSTTITSVRELKSDIPTVFALEQNYPNPFNPTTKISFSIPKDDFVILKIYDMLGREVQTLVNEFQIANTYSVNFDASNLSNGVYFYRLQIGQDFVEAKKMLLIK